MNNWKNYTVNIGYVKQNTSIDVKFESNGHLDIQHISSICGSCNKFLDYKDNILTFKYTAPSLPIHLNTREAVIRKEVTIYYTDGSSEELKFVGFLKKIIMDKVSQDRIDQLHPSIRLDVSNLIEKINTKVLTGRAKVRIAQGLRTFAEQDALYAQGRTKPGKKVTNAKGGQSIHNYGLAVDIVLILDGKTASWDEKSDFDRDQQSDWIEVVTEFKRAGFSWGGDWRTFKDMPHFEKTSGLSLKQIQDKYKRKDFIRNTTYINL